MIHYLNNAANEIQYTAADGTVITRNPFDPEFVLISQRLSVQHATEAENQQKRKNYEDAVRNSQVSIDAGRPAAVLPDPPVCIEYPEDYHLDSKVIPWDPPLLTIRAASGVPMPSIPIGPDSPFRPQPAVLSDEHSAALAIITQVSPYIPAIVAFFQSLFGAHKSNTPPPPAAPPAK